jgi:glycosyltransferase involved in cell wall biosynthesis
MRAVVVSEHMGPPLDEGIRKFATMLVRGLGASCEASGICTGSEMPAARTSDLQHANGGRLFRARELGEALRAAAPDLVVYVPSASGTLFSFLRARALKRAAPKARVAMILTQGRKHTAPVRRLLRRLSPDFVLCQSQPGMDYLSALGIEARFIPGGVDLDAFRSVSPAEKAALREKYALPTDEFLVLHAGHLKRERNTELLTRLDGVGRGVVLASRRMGFDEGVLGELKRHGVIVIDRYVEDTHEVYQACDCYLFPVSGADSAMEFPLSVLEAMACNLPVVALPYGGLPLALEARDGLVFAESEHEMIELIRRAQGAGVKTRAQAEAFGWVEIGRTLLTAVGERDAGAIAAAV